MNAHILIAVVAVALLAGAYFKGRTDGGTAVRGEYAARDLKAAQDYAAKEKAITDTYRKKEAQWQKQVAAASKELQVAKDNNETAKIAALAAVDAGDLRLRLTDSADCSPGRSQPTETATPTSGSDGDAEGRFLGKADSAFLIAEASRADAVVNQLTACQQVLIEERQ